MKQPKKQIFSPCPHPNIADYTAGQWGTLPVFYSYELSFPGAVWGEVSESLCLCFFTYNGSKTITLQDCDDSGMRFVKH